MKGRMGPNPKKAKQEETGAAGGTEEMVGTQQKKQGGKTSAAGEGSSASSADPVNTPPPRIPFPAFPTSGTARDVVKWSKNCRKIGMILAKDPRNYLPTMRGPKDPYTRDAVQSPMDKEIVLSVAPSIVSVSSIGHDGVKIQQCSGIVIQQWEDKVKTRAIVATCSAVVCKRGKLLDPKPKLSIGLPDSTILEGELVFFNDHYDLALVEIQVPVPLLLPSIGSCPQYGMKVLALARDEESTLMARLGEVKYLEESNYLGRNYYVFLNGEIPEKGTGGPVVDYNGSVRGMAFSCSPYPAVLSISTIITCCKMWSNFGRIARPLHGLGVRTIQLLELSLHDRLRRDYGIDTGFIVDKVSYGSC
ncbi:uncharacterized protein LOC133924683 [Phragmites australis]|uniref:uncharacterized protein LOC133924683 n=1 Tax=Phragmites australis TaxID=29695 RepID=UPI002D769A77|nr:uncharacterized protein LOC133924683 [Phragmites australis]XP_062226318.1 uncharacterized protein LOC133924683 [Phragmites australis]XP_062226319.1 uncharacterized protein LOC133924683 [Phragmites australis]XP_062226320.1 uncharacterized protein LOC133924683 [Phragmites australis]XP_062226321.1 uncharacterized protein LOC133924683 [Phragmites australis]